MVSALKHKYKKNIFPQILCFGCPKYTETENKMLDQLSIHFG